ncbi:MAG: hypothetical protein V8R82_04295 [Clostridia bacterium]
MEQSVLEKFNSNIIKWYPFEKEKSILQVRKNEWIQNELEKNNLKIDTVESIEDNTDYKYDYVLIYGYENYNNNIKEIISMLNENGKILIIGNNQFGINTWSKYDLDSNKGVLNLEEHQKENKTISSIKKELKQEGLDTINTFLAFPDYKTSELIVNEKFDLDKSQIEKYNPNIDEGEIKVFDEIKVLKNILENASEMKEFFANSYFIEASKNKNNNDIKYISFNNCRKEEYQLMTIIKDDVVEKLPTNAKAQKHIENMGKIIKNIKNENIEILDYEENSKIYSKLVKNEKTLDRMLTRKYNNIEELIQILNEYKNVLLQNSKSYSECKEKINIDGNEEQLEQLNYLKNGYWDLIPKNCFYINQKFVFFDQEWEKDYLPVEFILYRAIINSYDLVRKINVEELLKEINILQYKELFEKLDEKIRDEIIDNKVHEAMYKKYDLKAIDNLINDNKAYYEENSRKDEYIKKLEKYVEELKLDNTKKQEYIEILEEKLSKKKKRFF